MNDMKKKNIILSIVVIMAGLMIAGGTYAYLNITVNTTNNVYNATSACFLIDYNINNTDNSQDISGTLFPSGTLNKGLSGRVGLKTNSNCNLSGLGTIKLHINSGTSSKLMTKAASYCANRSTLEPISGITTKNTCIADNVKGRWYGYSDATCENPSTLEKLDYSYLDCVRNGGIYVSPVVNGGNGGLSASPLKYAIYDNAELTGDPIARNYIPSSAIGTDYTLMDNIIIDSTQKYFYIYIWLDGNYIDDTYTELPFSGYIKAEATQAETISTIYRYGTAEAVVKLGNRVALDSSQTFEGWCAYDDYYGNTCDVGYYFATQSECSNYIDDNDWEDNSGCELGTVQPISYETNPANLNKTVYLKHIVVNGIVTESYIVFVVTPEMVQNNPTMTAGTYYLRGLHTKDGLNYTCESQYIFDNSHCVSPYYGTNRAILQTAFGSSKCNASATSEVLYCSVNGLSAQVDASGAISVSGCYISSDGESNCN